MTEQQENILIARLIEFREGSYNPTAMIRIIKSILSPLPHQDGASAEDVLKEFTWEDGNEPFVDMYIGTTKNILSAMRQFAQLKCQEKDTEIKQIRAEALDIYTDLVEANARIKNLEQGISNWVRVSNERQEELNEAERRVKELEERLESQKGNMVIDKEFVDNLSQGFKGKRFKTK